jgi:hypothetical protein
MIKEIMKTIKISTLATNGNLVCYLRDVQRQILITLKDTDLKESTLFPGMTYSLEWYVQSDSDASYSINAVVIPASQDFPFIWRKDYIGKHNDMGGFSFVA